MRLLLSLALLACLLAPGARAQATADQLNKLSLEALTAPPARGSGGGGYAPARRSYGYRSYAGHSYAHRSYASRSYARPYYARHYARPAWHARRSYAAHWSRAPQRRYVAHWTRAPHRTYAPRTHRVSHYTPKFYRR